MSIVLRVEKGSALTYDEMDKNLSQFYYSSSLNSEGTILKLFYTGSAALGSGYEIDRFHSIPIQAGDTIISGSTVTVAGSDTQVQFNDNGFFGAVNGFTFKKANNFLGIGTANALARVDVQGDTAAGGRIALRSSNTGTNKIGSADFYEGTTSIGRVGKIISGEKDIYLTANSSNKIKFEVGTTGLAASQIATINGTGLAVGVQNNALFDQKITTVSTTSGLGIASTTNYTDTQNRIRPLPTALVSNTSGGKLRLIPDQSNPAGLLIESPRGVNGGSVVVAINTNASELEGFNIIKADESNYASLISNGTLASFQASGKHGLNTNYPSVVGLTIEGEVSSSGTLTVGTVATGNAASSSALVITPEGLVQKIASSTSVPVGGIIMWSGTIVSIPSGWNLCDGSNGTPNLQDKFVVGAGSAYTTGSAGGSKDAVVVSHTHTGTTTSNGSHFHYAATDESATNNNQAPITSATSMKRRLGENSVSQNYTLMGSNTTPTVGKTSTESNHNHSISLNSTGVSGTDQNLPPYYALAYIMYIG